MLLVKHTTVPATKWYPGLSFKISSTRFLTGTKANLFVILSKEGSSPQHQSIFFGWKSLVSSQDEHRKWCFSKEQKRTHLWSCRRRVLCHNINPYSLGWQSLVSSQDEHYPWGIQVGLSPENMIGEIPITCQYVTEQNSGQEKPTWESPIQRQKSSSNNNTKLTEDCHIMTTTMKTHQNFFEVANFWFGP